MKTAFYIIGGLLAGGTIVWLLVNLMNGKKEKKPDNTQQEDNSQNTDNAPAADENMPGSDNSADPAANYPATPPPANYPSASYPMQRVAAQNAQQANAKNISTAHKAQSAGLKGAGTGKLMKP